MICNIRSIGYLLLMLVMAASLLHCTKAAGPSIANMASIPSKPDFHIKAPNGKDKANALVDIYDSNGLMLGEFALSGSELYESNAQHASESLDGHIHAIIRPQLYLYEPWVNDFHAWVAYSGGLDHQRLQAGLGYSPDRLLYHTLGVPDFVLSKDAIGAGAVFYPPPRYFSRYVKGLGIGAWYLVPFNGGHPSLAYGLSVSPN